MIKYNKLEKWTFGIDTDKLINLVLDGRKTATSSLYKFDNLPIVGDISVLTDLNNNSVCVVKTKEVIVTEFKRITWDLAKLEGEDKSLKEWRRVHIDYFNKIDSSFNENTKVIFEIFEVTEIFK